MWVHSCPLRSQPISRMAFTACSLTSLPGLMPALQTSTPRFTDIFNSASAIGLRLEFLMQTNRIFTCRPACAQFGRVILGEDELGSALTQEFHGSHAQRTHHYWIAHRFNKPRLLLDRLLEKIGSLLACVIKKACRVVSAHPARVGSAKSKRIRECSKPAAITAAKRV